jgi:Fe-S oxidoreductase
MLRYRAVENQKENMPPEGLSKPTEFASVEESTGSKLNMREKVHVEEGLDRSLSKETQSWMHGLYTSTDLMGKIMTKIPWLANWATSKDAPAIFKRLMKDYAGISEKAALPTYVSDGETFVNKAKTVAVTPNPSAPASGKRKVVLFATCIVNYNKPDIGHAARAVLAHNGVEVKVEYPMCCGMPQFESGLVQDVSKRAAEFSQKMRKYVDQGYEFVTPTASCTLMLKKEWPLLLPLDENVKLLSQKTFDIGEYVVLISKQHGLTKEGLRELPEAITLHHACHQRAQGAGFKSQEMLQMIPNVKISSIERCSGHGGSFGVQVKGHESAVKVGKPVFRNTIRNMTETGSSVPDLRSLQDAHLIWPCRIQRSSLGILGLPTSDGPYQAWRHSRGQDDSCIQGCAQAPDRNHGQGLRLGSPIKVNSIYVYKGSNFIDSSAPTTGASEVAFLGQ